jgi:hypothetical protein
VAFVRKWRRKKGIIFFYPNKKLSYRGGLEHSKRER